MRYSSRGLVRVGTLGYDVLVVYIIIIIIIHDAAVLERPPWVVLLNNGPRTRKVTHKYV